METIEDILREMRSIKGGQHTNGGRSYEIWRMLCKVADDYADRIEAAAKRQTMLCHSACYCDLLFQANFEADKLKTENTKLKAALKTVVDNYYTTSSMRDSISNAEKVLKGANI